MKFDNAALGTNWYFRRSPSVWNTLWMIPLAVVLLLCGAWLTQADDRTAREVWDSERACPAEPPCADVRPVTRFTSEPGGRRSSTKDYVWFVTESGDEVSTRYDIGLVAHQRADFGAGTEVWLLDGEAIGLVDSRGRRWVDFGAASQNLVLETMAGVWLIWMALLTLAWVPQTWRWAGASPRLPGLVKLRFLTLAGCLGFIIPAIAAFLRLPSPVVVAVGVVLWAPHIWFWTKCWWLLWREQQR